MKKQNKQQVPTLGLDFGKVIMGAVIDGKADTSFLGSSFAAAMKTQPTDGAIDAVTKLITHFGGNAWIVSKCGPSVQAKTVGWLKSWDFYQKTGCQQATFASASSAITKLGSAGSSASHTSSTTGSTCSNPCAASLTTSTCLARFADRARLGLLQRPRGLRWSRRSSVMLNHRLLSARFLEYSWLVSPQSPPR